MYFVVPLADWYHQFYYFHIWAVPGVVLKLSTSWSNYQLLCRFAVVVVVLPRGLLALGLVALGVAVPVPVAVAVLSYLSGGGTTRVGGWVGGGSV